MAARQLCKTEEIEARRRELIKEYWWFKPFIWAISITFFLFFIDEGYFSLRWMLSWGNFVVFALYVAALFPLLMAVRWVYGLVLRLLFRL